MNSAVVADSSTNQKVVELNPLELACKFGDIDDVKYWLQKGTYSINKNECRCLRLAIHNGYVDICKVLITVGANVSHRTIHVAIKGGHQKCIELVLHRKIDRIDPQTFAQDLDLDLDISYLDISSVTEENLANVVLWCIEKESASVIRKLMALPVYSNFMQLFKHDEAFLDCIKETALKSKLSDEKFALFQEFDSTLVAVLLKNKCQFCGSTTSVVNGKCTDLSHCTRRKGVPMKAPI